MFTLARNVRSAIGGFALIAFAGAFATTPSELRRAAAVPLPPAHALAAGTIVAGRAAHPARSFIVQPRRDPFQGDASSAPSPPATPVAASSPMVSANLPPMPSPPPVAPARVTAIVTGKRPFALIQETGTSRIVTTGDIVNGDRVTAIRRDGVSLSRGSVLLVDSTSSPSTEGR